MAAPTLRSLARELGVSRTTISEALRGSPRVRASTAERIRVAAAAAGYHHNPLAGAIMSELRRSRGELFRGVLAIIGVDEPDRPAYSERFHRELVSGATARAAELGFKVERFTIGPLLTQRRLNHILQSRSIRGVLLLPTWRDPDFLKLEWPRYAGVYLDYQIARPALRCICSDHFRSMMDALQRLRGLGYRRPGVILPRHHDERIHHRWEGAFLAFQQHHPAPRPVPPLVIDVINERSFSAWFRRHDPDVVLGHFVEAIDWMRACGAKVPRTHGFFCLNLVHAEGPCAGLDQEPHQIGVRGVDIVVAQLHRNERGVPKSVSLTTLSSTWVDGPTLRRRPGAV
ncbi:MAG: LacI family transcriptional regulator [Verrucomicrobia bacterium]|nr:LacI family transcriptional regulator [Verrucomicrobiota bacterium]